MSDTKGLNQSRDRAPRRSEASAADDASVQQLAQGQTSAATRYWQGVAEAGRAAKPAATTPTEGAKPERQRGLRT